MRALGELDVWNDAHDGESKWYDLVQAGYRQGELSEKEWRAYRGGYEAVRGWPVARAHCGTAGKREASAR